MLKNPGFVNKAPEAKVNAEKEKLASYTEKLEMTKTQLDNILKKLGQNKSNAQRQTLGVFLTVLYWREKMSLDVNN